MPGVNIITNTNSTDCIFIPINDIRVDPGHIRKNPGNVNGLKYTISDVGLLQPILVRRSGSFYMVIDGERRLQAMKELAISELILGREVLIDVEETEADARFKQIIANIQREDIDPIDLGRAFVTLKEKYGYKYNEIAEIIGKTPHYVTSKVGLVKRLAPEVLEIVAEDREASKCIQDTFFADNERRVPNLKIIEDIARLPHELQKNAYLTIRSEDMQTGEALEYLRSVKKGCTGKHDKKVITATPDDDLVRQIERLDRDVEELAGCIQTTAQLNRPDVIWKIEMTLEKLSSLYVRLKNEAPDGSRPEQARGSGLAVYGKQECINAHYS